MYDLNASIIILGIISGFVILINPFLGLIAIVALFPQALLQPITSSLFGLFTIATPIKVLGAITFISAFIRYSFAKKSFSFFKKPQVKLYILFTILIFISGFSKPCAFTRENFTNFIAFAALGFIILSLVNNLNKYKVIIWTSLISMFILSFNVIIQYVKATALIRMQGASYDPNYFAIIILPFLGISFYNIGCEKNIFLKIISAIIMATMFFALLFTFSRGGFVGFIFMALIALLKTKRKLLGCVFLIIATILFINFAPNQFWERFKKIKLEEEYSSYSPDAASISVTARIQRNKAAWRIFLKHPFFGIGIGNYYYEARTYLPMTPGRAHNMYLEVLAELGLIGLLLLLAIFFFTFKTLKTIIVTNSIYSGYARGLYIGLAGFLLAGLFLHAQQEKVLWFAVFMPAALENIASNKIASDSSTKSKIDGEKR